MIMNLFNINIMKFIKRNKVDDKKSNRPKPNRTSSVTRSQARRSSDGLGDNEQPKIVVEKSDDVMYTTTPTYPRFTGVHDSNMLQDILVDLKLTLSNQSGEVVEIGEASSKRKLVKFVE